MYFSYLKEREGRESIVTEHSFVTYNVYDDHIVIYDMYIKPEFRGIKEVSDDLIARLFQVANAHGCKKCVATIDISTKGAMKSLSFNIKHNFVIVCMKDNIITLVKDL